MKYGWIKYGTSILELVPVEPPRGVVTTALIQWSSNSVCSVRMGTDCRGLDGSIYGDYLINEASKEDKVQEGLHSISTTRPLA